MFSRLQTISGFHEDRHEKHIFHGENGWEPSQKRPEKNEIELQTDEEPGPHFFKATLNSRTPATFRSNSEASFQTQCIDTFLKKNH